MDKFDHAVIFSADENRNEAENALLEWAKKYELRHYIMPSRTTAENMAIYFYRQFRDYFEQNEISNVHGIDVQVFETPTSCAEV